MASIFSAMRSLRCSAAVMSGFQSLRLTISASFSVCAGSFSSASLKCLSADSSLSTVSSASSGHAWMHRGSPWHRLHAIALPVSAFIAIPPCGQAWTHQSQPLHFFSSMINKLFTSLCVMARSGHAFTHLASWQPLQVRAKLNTGAIRTTRILLRTGFQLFTSPFSEEQAYSQIPQPMHLLGSTATNFLGKVLADDIVLTKPFGVKVSLCIIAFYALPKKNNFSTA